MHEIWKHMFVVVFVSSRRRHRISLCDWSSDVCSSDLVVSEIIELRNLDIPGHGNPDPAGLIGLGLRSIAAKDATVRHRAHGTGRLGVGGDKDRSEERRVGKECRSRWSPYH